MGMILALCSLRASCSCLRASLAGESDDIREPRLGSLVDPREPVFVI